MDDVLPTISAAVIQATREELVELSLAAIHQFHFHQFVMGTAVVSMISVSAKVDIMDTIVL